MFNIFNHTQFTGINTGTEFATSTGGTGSALFNVADFSTLSVVSPARRRSVANGGSDTPEGSTRPLGDFFGEPNAARDPRIIQLAVKLYF